MPKGGMISSTMPTRGVMHDRLIFHEISETQPGASASLFCAEPITSTVTVMCHSIHGGSLKPSQTGRPSQEISLDNIVYALEI